MAADRLSEKDDWLRTLKALGLRAEMRILERIEPSQVQPWHADEARRVFGASNVQSVPEYAMDLLVSAREDAWIATARDLGWPLLSGGGRTHLSVAATWWGCPAIGISAEIVAIIHRR